MIGIIGFLLMIGCLVFLTRSTIEDKINFIRLKQAIKACGLQCSEIDSKTGIHFTRYIINLSNELSFLEFYQFSKPLCKYLKRECVAYKEDNQYIVDVNKSRRINHLDKLCSQTNYYNIFDFQGNKMLINIFNHIMLIDVDKNFFINSLRNYTTQCIVREDLTVEDVIYIIEHRKHKHFRESNNNSNVENIFVIFEKCDNSDIDFILKYGKEVNVYLIIIADQKIINKYGLKVNYIFYHGDMMEKYNISDIAPILPVSFTEYTSDVYVFNRTIGHRVCIL